MTTNISPSRDPVSMNAASLKGRVCADRLIWLSDKKTASWCVAFGKEVIYEYKTKKHFTIIDVIIKTETASELLARSFCCVICVF